MALPPHSRVKETAADTEQLAEVCPPPTPRRLPHLSLGDASVLAPRHSIYFLLILNLPYEFLLFPLLDTQLPLKMSLPGIKQVLYSIAQKTCFLNHPE